MIVITTSTGQIGRQVLGHLLESGEQLRVIARDPSQLPAGVREDLDIVEGSHGDAAVADKAFAGADAVLWLTPTDRRAPTVTVVRPRRPGRSWQRTAIITYSPYRAALQRTLSVSITRSRCLRQSNPGLGPITLTTPQISIAMSVASMPGRIVPARRARPVSSAMTAISSSCSACASDLAACAALLASAYWTPASPAAVSAIRRSSPSISANGSPPALSASRAHPVNRRNV